MAERRRHREWVGQIRVWAAAGGNTPRLGERVPALRARLATRNGARTSRNDHRRYADDIVVGFQHKRDAERYLRDVRERLARFGLSLDKTRLVEFGRFADLNRRQRGVGKPETFDFLGLTHYCTTTLRGRFRLGRKPVAKRVNRTLARIDEVLRKRWHHDIWEVGRWLGRVCNGWLNYFAVPGSGRFIRAFLRRLQRRWMRALRRRSQRARFSWKRLERMTEILWPRASIRHPWPDQRFAVKHPR